MIIIWGKVSRDKCYSQTFTKDTIDQKSVCTLLLQYVQSVTADAVKILCWKSWFLFPVEPQNYNWSCSFTYLDFMVLKVKKTAWCCQGKHKLRCWKCCKGGLWACLLAQCSYWGIYIERSVLFRVWWTVLVAKEVELGQSSRSWTAV